MFKVEDDDFMFMSTSKDNCEYARLFFGIGNNVENVEDYFIYDVFNDFNKVKRFKKKFRVYSQPATVVYGNYYDGFGYGRRRNKKIIGGGQYIAGVWQPNSYYL